LLLAGLIVGLISVWLYSNVRAFTNGLGFDLQTSLVAFMLAFVASFIAGGVVVLMLWGRRIAGKDECHTCGYDVRGLGSPVCPECGEKLSADLVLRKPDFSARALIVILLLTPLAGCILGETLLLTQEAIFRHQAPSMQPNVGGMHVVLQGRWWPCHDSLWIGYEFDTGTFIAGD
jgi:hypothetical protein